MAMRSINPKKLKMNLKGLGLVKSLSRYSKLKIRMENNSTIFKTSMSRTERLGRV
jgi:hypothetical protein